MITTTPSRQIASLELEPTWTRALPNLEKRVAALPFDIIPQVIQREPVFEAPPPEDIVEALRDSIPFQFDTIVTRSGSNVQERRGTAWVAEDGIGALAYSGKLMPPHALPTVVRKAMRHVERHVLEDEDGTDSQPFFDCALCNPGTSTWSEWDIVVDRDSNPDETLPAVIQLFPGDVVKMWGSCNDNFHHSVYTSQDSKDMGGGRVSLVFKRAIRRTGGKQGHGN